MTPEEMRQIIREELRNTATKDDIQTLRNEMAARFDEHESHFAAINNRLDEHEQYFSAIRETLGTIEEQTKNVDLIKDLTRALSDDRKEEINGLNGRVKVLEADVQTIKTKVGLPRV